MLCVIVRFWYVLSSLRLCVLRVCCLSSVRVSCVSAGPSFAPAGLLILSHYSVHDSVQVAFRTKTVSVFRYGEGFSAYPQCKERYVGRL